MQLSLSSERVLDYTVTDSPPDWSTAGRPASRGLRFYIDADVGEGWPYRAVETLCKFGVTSKPPETRCGENEDVLQRTWGIEADLEVCFVATGEIACEEVEERVRDHTLPWLPEEFLPTAEWRHCSPRQLARIAVLIAEDRLRPCCL